MTMHESGEVTPPPPGQGVPHSARAYLHVAPRSVSLLPGEVKRLQLALRKPANLEPGEYRAHLKMRMVNDSADYRMPRMPGINRSAYPRRRGW
jgi:hypothetical protein